MPKVASIVTAPADLKGSALVVLESLAKEHLVVRIKWLPKKERGEADMRYQVECKAFGRHFLFAAPTLEAAALLCQSAVDDVRRRVTEAQ